jgi:hypothetical protein
MRGVRPGLPRRDASKGGGSLMQTPKLALLTKNPNPKTSQIGTRVSADVKVRLEEICVAEEIKSVSSLVEALIVSFIKDYEGK